jgi:hypothetical protein
MPTRSTPNPDHRGSSETDRRRHSGGPVPAPTTWRTEPPPPSGVLSPVLARRLLDYLTDTGDIVLDVDDDVVLARAAAEGGRRHHGLGGYRRLLNNRHYAGSAHLVFLRWPQPPADPRLLLAGCRTLLIPTGHLVIAVHTSPTDLHALASAADDAEMPRPQHIAVADDAFPQTGAPHTDLLIFTTRGGDHA